MKQATCHLTCFGSHCPDGVHVPAESEFDSIAVFLPPLIEECYRAGPTAYRVQVAAFSGLGFGGFIL